jgi:predicted amidohydrolase YtcJ
LTKPYADGSLPGPIWPPSKLFPVVDLADALDMQIAIHAIGDAAVDNALDAFEHAIETNGPRPDRRNRIEHLEMVTTESIKRLTRLGVIASLQPTHADPAGLDNYREMLGGDERVDRLWPTTEYIDEGSHVAFGSDPPSAPYPALPNIYSSTTRKSLTKPHHCTRHDAMVRALEKYKIPLETSIRFYTLGTAYSTRDEGEYGSLEPGKQADFCILDIDPFGDGVMGLREAQGAVGETWMGGERVWVRQANGETRET